MPITIAMDTGGTFTDGIFTEDDRIERVKVDTTPHDLTVCFRNCITAGAERFGLSVPALLTRAEVIRFSTTVGTNSLIERRGVRLGLLVTQGDDENRYLGSADGVNPLIRKGLVRALDEEVDETGRLVRGLQPESVRYAIESLLDEGARFLVVSLRNSHLNPVNEREVKAILSAQYPRQYLGAVPILAASDISVRAGDATRTNTAILNAYLHPQVSSFLYRAEDYLREHSYRRPLLIAHSTGGVARVAKTTAINTYNSGPVSGLLGSRHVAAMYGLKDFVTMDVGGTSLDIGVAIDGKVALNEFPVVGGVPLNIPLVEVETVGLGGGSIVRVNPETKALTIGPDSAGSVPGPAAFDLGGSLATVTDADLVLGYLSADNFLGGQRRLRKELAEEAIREHIAQPLGLSLTEAAWRIVQEVELQMGGNIRRAVEPQGYSPSQFALFVYGGGGGLRGVGASRHIGCPKVYLCEQSSAFSAFGADTLDVMHLYEANLGLPISDQATWARVAEEARLLVRRAERDMRGEGFSPEKISYKFEALLTFDDGLSEVVEVAGAYLGEGAIPVALSQHRGSLAILRMRAIGATPHFTFPTVEPTAPNPDVAKTGERLACCGGLMRTVSVYSRDRLLPGHVVEGPAVVEGNDTTYWVPESARLSMDRFRNCVLEVNHD